MGLFTNLLLLPVTGPYRGVRFLLECIQDQVNAEWWDEGQIRADLLTLSLRLEQGELSEDGYLEAEAGLLERLNQARALREEAAASAMVEADVAADEEPNIAVETDILDHAEPDRAQAADEGE